MSSRAVSALLRPLRARDVRLRQHGDTLRVDAPAGVVSDGERIELRAHKTELLARLRLEHELLGLTISEFQNQTHRIEVRVPGFDETLWFVPGKASVQKLRSQGVHRGRIWTAQELSAIYEIGQLDRKELQRLALLKKRLDLEVISVTTAGSSPEGTDNPDHCAVARESDG